MTNEERTTWAGLLSLVAVPVAYLLWLAGRGGIPEAGWELPVAVAFVALVVVGVVASTAVTVVAAARGDGARGDAESDEVGVYDERDAVIGQRAGRLSGVVLGLWVAAVFVLAILQVAHVWIAHALLGAVVTAGLVDAVARIAAYRRG